MPGDDAHVMYVWFDALVNYVSTLGFPNDMATVEQFWPSVQIAGKDNLRQQSAMWQAMLLSAGLPPSRQILIHGHIMSGGQKMSKTLGNVIAPDELVARFGVDGTRYLLLSSGNLEHDPDVTLERLSEKYNADLANGLGNLVSRVVKLSEQLDVMPEVKPSDMDPDALMEHTWAILESYRFADAVAVVWERIRKMNKYIDEHKPWKLAKSDQAEFEGVMRLLFQDLSWVADALRPMLPGTSEKIQKALKTGKTEPLFLRVA